MHYSPSKHTITVTSDVSYNVEFKIDQKVIFAKNHDNLVFAAVVSYDYNENNGQ